MSRLPISKNSGSTNSGPDVSQLEGESLSTTSFPVPRSASFRVHFDPLAYAGMTAHATEDVSFEICGVLVGDWGRDADGPFVTVRNYVRCDSAAKKFAEVTFTHESWSHINKEMDTKFQDQRIVGWYHSHPNFGIFLSDRDVFIQQNFFSGPGQIALVIDPVRKVEGVFEWSHGQTIPTPHYWVGTRVILAPAGSGVTGMPESPPVGSAVAAEEVTYRSMGSSSATAPGATLMTLAGMGLFLLGWLLSGWRTNAERRAIIEGTVAHLGIWGIVRPGLEEQLTAVENNLGVVESQLSALAKDHLDRVTKSGGDKDDEKTTDRTRQDWKKAIESTDYVRQQVRHVEKLYSMSPEERAAIRQFVDQKFLELSDPPNRPTTSGHEEVDEKTGGQNSRAPKAPTPARATEKSATSKPNPAVPQNP